MKALDRKLLARFVRLAGEKLRGDWVMVGGTVLPLLGIEHRTTTDIDITAVGKETQGELLKLMGIAERLGLPVEAINPAAGFFLRKVPKFRSRLVEVHRGPRATIYRPDATLYARLKIPRLTESDLLDCLAMFRYAAKHGENWDARLLRKLIDAELAKAASPERAGRLRALREVV